MRLTEKETDIIGVETGFYRLKKDYSNSFIPDKCGNQRELNSVFLGQQKLGQLEDIEDEFGIDLITLFKACQQKYVFVKNAFGEINSRELYYIDIYTKIIVYYFEYQPERQLMYQHLNMYGITWALTREELENE